MARWRRRPEPVIPVCPFPDPEQWRECNAWLDSLPPDVAYVILVRQMRGEWVG